MQGLLPQMMADGHMGSARRSLGEADRLREDARLDRFTDAQRVSLLRDAEAENRQALRWAFATRRS